MNALVLRWSITSALAGFLFGFDTVVISGAEQKIKSLWELSDGLHGLAMSAALWGTVLGSIFGSVPADYFGRRKTLLAVGLLYFVSAAWSGFAPEVYSLIVARFIGGLGVGISTVVSPMFISEIAPPKHRGFLTGMFQFNIVFGILVAFGSNAALASLGEEAWRWMLGVEAIPALIYTVLCFGIPESPRWLILKRNNRKEAETILHRINPEMSEEAIQNFSQKIAESQHANQSKLPFWSRRLRVPILLAFFLAAFNQLSGINAVLYFAPRIFALTGLGNEAALLQSVGIGITNFLFTLLGLWLIDRVGRKVLLIVGSLGYIASLALCAYAFFTETYGIVPACIFAFIAAHAVGQGAVIWVFISEVFPNQDRAKGQSFGCATHWIFAATITQIFPAVVEAFPTGYIFAFFSSMMVLQLCWVLLFVPETKGVALEDIRQKLGS